jgi:hypothetical protein
MDTVHWVQPEKAKECPVCGMFLEQKSSDAKKSGHEGHDHGGH